MTYFPTAFSTIASNPRGEALEVRISVRLNDGTDGAPGTLLTVTDGQEIIQVSQIQRKRERSFGVIQGQAWQVQVTNIDLAMLAYELPGCWACIEGGFPIADEWVVFAQGKISSFTASTGGVVNLEVHDSIMDLLNFALPRKIRFQDTGWISDVSTVSKAEGSKAYDNTTALALSNAALADDETFQIVFTTATAFNVLLEDGTTGGTGTISTYCTVTNLAGDTGNILIDPAGWDTATGAYTAGDTYEFSTARPRTTAELSPINMVKHLIEDVAGLSAYDVLNGAAYSSPLYDSTNWTALGSAASTHTIAGTFNKGVSISVLVQDALKVVHGTIYPAPLGQIGVWMLQPAAAGALVLNGNPNSGQIDIISAQYTDTLEDTVSDVLFKYLTLGSGEDASFSASVDLADSPLLARKYATIQTTWEVRPATIESASNQYLARNTESKREHTINTTLTGAVADLGGAVTISDAAIGQANTTVSLTEINTNLMGNSAQIRAHNDPYVMQSFFIIGQSLIGGSDVLL